MEILKPGTIPVVPQTDLRGTCSKCGAEVKCTDVKDEALLPYPRSHPRFIVRCPTKNCGGLIDLTQVKTRAVPGETSGGFD